MEIIRHIKVDLYGDTQHFAVAAKQMDMGTRYVGVTLMEDGVVYEIPDNVEVIVNMTKPDRTNVHNDGERLGNEALIPLTRGMLMAHGTAVCEVQLYQNGALLTSANFEMEIFPSQRDDAEIMHSGEYTRLENTIHAAREALHHQILRPRNGPPENRRFGVCESFHHRLALRKDQFRTGFHVQPQRVDAAPRPSQCAAEPRLLRPDLIGAIPLHVDQYHQRQQGFRQRTFAQRRSRYGHGAGA